MLKADDTRIADADLIALTNNGLLYLFSSVIVQPNDVRKVNLYKSIASSNVIPVSFRMRQCETFSLPQASMAIRC